MAYKTEEERTLLDIYDKLEEEVKRAKQEASKYPIFSANNQRAREAIPGLLLAQIKINRRLMEVKKEGLRSC